MELEERQTLLKARVGPVYRVGGGKRVEERASLPRRLPVVASPVHDIRSCCQESPIRPERRTPALQKSVLSPSKPTSPPRPATSPSKPAASPSKPTAYPPKSPYRTSQASAQTSSVIPKLHIDNLPLTATKDEVVAKFQCCGDISDCFIVPSKNGDVYTYGFVRYDSMFSALAAIRKLNNTRWGDQTIAVTWTNSPTGTSHDSKGSVQKQRGRYGTKLPDYSVYVKRIPLNTREDTLKRLFSKVGIVKDVCIMELKPQQENLCGFVQMSTQDEAQSAVQRLSNYSINPLCPNERIIVNMPYCSLSKPRATCGTNTASLQDILGKIKRASRTSSSHMAKTSRSQTAPCTSHSCSSDDPLHQPTISQQVLESYSTMFPPCSCSPLPPSDSPGQTPTTLTALAAESDCSVAQPSQPSPGTSCLEGGASDKGRVEQSLSPVNEQSLSPVNEYSTVAGDIPSCELCGQVEALKSCSEDIELPSSSPSFPELDESPPLGDAADMFVLPSKDQNSSLKSEPGSLSDFATCGRGKLLMQLLADGPVRKPSLPMGNTSLCTSMPLNASGLGRGQMLSTFLSRVSSVEKDLKIRMPPLENVSVREKAVKPNAPMRTKRRTVNIAAQFGCELESSGGDLSPSPTPPRLSHPFILSASHQSPLPVSPPAELRSVLPVECSRPKPTSSDLSTQLRNSKASASEDALSCTADSALTTNHSLSPTDTTVSSRVPTPTLTPPPPPHPAITFPGASPGTSPLPPTLHYNLAPTSTIQECHCPILSHAPPRMARGSGARPWQQLSTPPPPQPQSSASAERVKTSSLSSEDDELEFREGRQGRSTQAIEKSIAQHQRDIHRHQTELKRLQQKNRAMDLELSAPDLSTELPLEVSNDFFRAFDQMAELGAQFATGTWKLKRREKQLEAILSKAERRLSSDKLALLEARLEVEAEETLDHVRLARLENRLLQAKIDIFDP